MQTARHFDYLPFLFAPDGASADTGGTTAAFLEGATVNSALIDGVLAAQKQLLGGAPATEAVPAALAAVSAAAKVDRAYVFSFKNNADGAVYASQRYEWVAEGVEPQLENPELQDIPMYAAGYGRWVDHFRRYDLVHGTIAEFPESEQEKLSAQGIISLVVLPIYVNAALWGFVGFDDCVHSRPWSDSEVDLLLSLSISIGAALLRERYPNELADSNTGGLSVLVSGYSAIVSALAQAADIDDHCACGPSLLTMLRTGILVRAHEVLQRHFQDGPVDLSFCLHEMYDQLVAALRARTISLRLRLDLDSVQVSPNVLPPLGFMITEVLVAISCAERVTWRRELDAEVPEEDPGQAVLTFRKDGAAGELSVRLESGEGTELPAEGLLTGAQMLLLRRLAEDIQAQVSYGDGRVVRFRFPL